MTLQVQPDQVVDGVSPHVQELFDGRRLGNEARLVVESSHTHTHTKLMLSRGRFKRSDQKKNTLKYAFFLTI